MKGLSVALNCGTAVQSPPYSQPPRRPSKLIHHYNYLRSSNLAYKVIFALSTRQYHRSLVLFIDSYFRLETHCYHRGLPMLPSLIQPRQDVLPNQADCGTNSQAVGKDPVIAQAFEKKML